MCCVVFVINNHNQPIWCYNIGRPMPAIKTGSHMSPTFATTIVGDCSWVKSFVNFLLEWLLTMTRRSSATYENQALQNCHFCGLLPICFHFVLSDHGNTNQSLINSFWLEQNTLKTYLNHFQNKNDFWSFDVAMFVLVGFQFSRERWLLFCFYVVCKISKLTAGNQADFFQLLS